MKAVRKWAVPVGLATLFLIALSSVSAARNGATRDQDRTRQMCNVCQQVCDPDGGCLCVRDQDRDRDGSGQEDCGNDPLWDPLRDRERDQLREQLRLCLEEEALQIKRMEQARDRLRNRNTRRSADGDDNADRDAFRRQRRERLREMLRQQDQSGDPPLTGDKPNSDTGGLQPRVRNRIGFGATDALGCFRLLWLMPL